jgi:hypothetical protein
MKTEPFETHKTQSTAADVNDVHNNTRNLVRYDVSSRFSARYSGSLAPIDGGDLRIDF